MATFISLHRVLAQSVQLFMLAIAIIALYYALTKRELDGNFWGAVIIGEGLVIVQALMGLVLLIGGMSPGRWIHLLYGAVSILAWPSIFAFTGGRTTRRDAFTWFIFSIFIFTMVTLRAGLTGRIV